MTTYIDLLKEWESQVQPMMVSGTMDTQSLHQMWAVFCNKKQAEGHAAELAKLVGEPWTNWIPPTLKIVPVSIRVKMLRAQLLHPTELTSEGCRLEGWAQPSHRETAVATGLGFVPDKYDDPDRLDCWHFVNRLPINENAEERALALEWQMIGRKREFQCTLQTFWEMGGSKTTDSGLLEMIVDIPDGDLDQVAELIEFWNSLEKVVKAAGVISKGRNHKVQITFDPYITEI